IFLLGMLAMVKEALKGTSLLGLIALLATLTPAYAGDLSAHPSIGRTTEVPPQGDDADGIQTIDHFVPHISTVPANAGERVELFARERFQGHRRHSRPVVLMVHGATVSVVPGFDLPFENYSWMAYLAEAGFDVFAMDLTGYGLSPRPLMDD